jgi:hypothetical protein
MNMIAYKVTTYDLCPPIQGGAPIWDGDLPYQFPEVACDRSALECAPGWNACETPETALRIAGLWPDGRPSRVFEVEGVDIVSAGDKLRASTWIILRELAEDEIGEAIGRWSATWAGPVAAEMTRSQMAWRAALRRPERDEAAVEAGLRAALDRRGLGHWQLRRYESPHAARAARAAKDAARSAWDAGDARDADFDAAGSARDALSVEHAALRGWISHPADLLTVGIREAYAHGLGAAVPVAPETLGWAMVEEGP